MESSDIVTIGYYDTFRLFQLGLSFRVELPNLVTSANFGSSQVGPWVGPNANGDRVHGGAGAPLFTQKPVITRIKSRKWLADQSVQVELGLGRSSAWTEPTRTEPIRALVSSRKNPVVSTCLVWECCYCHLMPKPLQTWPLQRATDTDTSEDRFQLFECLLYAGRSAHFLAFVYIS